MTLINETNYRLSKEELSYLFKYHNLGLLKYIKLISKGIDSSTFSLITENESFVLTIFEEEPKNLTYVKEISHFFTSRGFPIAKILATCEISNKKAIISSHLTGKVKSDWSVDDYEAIGRFLGLDQLRGAL